MTEIILARGCGPFEFGCVEPGTSADFVAIAPAEFDVETISGSTWEVVSDCMITSVIVEDTKDIDGVSYNNVVTARIQNFVPQTPAVTQLTIRGDLSSQNIVYTFEIPVT